MNWFLTGLVVLAQFLAVVFLGLGLRDTGRWVGARLKHEEPQRDSQLG